MTLIDLVIIGGSFWAIWIVGHYKKTFVVAHQILGASLVVFGLAALGLFYLTDLFVMWVLPLFIAPSTAMTLMTELHLNFSWIIDLISVASIVAGFAFIVRGMVRLLDTLRESEQNRARELTALKRQGAALRFRQDFEHLLATLSTRFINADPATTDEVIHDALRAVGELVEVDRCGVFRQSDDGTVVSVTHEWHSESVGSMAEGFRKFPLSKFAWSAERVTSDGVLRVSRMEDLPPEARPERELWQQSGTRSALMVPMRVAGDIVGYLSMTAVRREIDWSDDAEQLVGLIGEMIAGAVERKRINEALQLSEAKIGKAFQTSPDAMTISTLPDGTMTRVNEAFEQMFGFAREEALGRTSLELNVYADPKDREKVMAALDRDGYVSGFEVAFRRKSGETGVAELSMRPFRVAGESSAFTVTRDITARKAAERALEVTQFAVDKAGEAIFWIDQHGRFTYVNDAACESLAYSRDELLTMHVADVSPDWSTERQAVFWTTLKAQGPQSFTSSHRAKNGHVHPVEISSTLLAYEGEETSIAFVRDITERVQAAESLRDSRQELLNLSHRLMRVQEAERLQIAQELHDELGQSLTAVRLNLDSIERSTKNSQATERISDSAEILDHTLDRVRAMALDLRPSMLDDLGLVAALRWYTARQTERSGIPIAFLTPEVESPLPDDVELACYRVAQEALTNVFRHADAQHATVRLDRRDHTLLLLVEDDGGGFDPNALAARIWEPG